MTQAESHPGTIISADSHFGEPLDLWVRNLPARFRDRALRWPKLKEFETNHHLRAGCWDPHARLEDMAVDGVSAEVLYPTQGAQAWLIDDLELQEAHLRVYNDYVIDFCSAAPQRFWGLAMVSLWDIDHAIAELERCLKAGLRGGDIWIAAPEELPYSSPHYERFWAAAEDLGVPLAMHINGRPRPRPSDPEATAAIRELHSINGHKFDAMNALGHLIAGGVMDRHPRLKFTVAEIGCGWIPFWLQEFDYYIASRTALPMAPSEYFHRQVFSTFISDEVAGYFLRDFAEDNVMFSNDYPHPACVWPESAVVIQHDLGHLPAETREKVAWRNAAGLFNHGEPPPPPDPVPTDREELDSWLELHPDFGASSRLRNPTEPPLWAARESTGATIQVPHGRS